MNAYGCCEAVSTRFRRTTDSGPAPKSVTRRYRDFAGWLVSGAILVLLPKCPACLAAYIAIGTGVGVSLPTATHLRMLLMILCVASLLYLAAKRMERVSDANRVLERFYIFSSACLKSSNRSRQFSIPTEMRTNPSVIPASSNSSGFQLE